jgi:dTDP-4-amino-4,6-dideoxygalactose transaminase
MSGINRMAQTVPFVNAPEHYRRCKTEIDEAITGCLERGDLINRSQLKDFEQQLAAFVGTTYAVGVNSGYHALHLSMLAAGIGPGDEVITVAHTFVATVSAIVHCGATPVLVDVGEDFNIDVGLIEAAVTPRTKAIVPVHLNGRMADMPAVLDLAGRRGLLVIEDAAQAAGAEIAGCRAGGSGFAGCFSFYPFKILGCLGDGGAVTTNDEHAARMVRLLRYNGEDRETGEYHHHGYTALLDNIQAAVLSVKLRHLPTWIEHRRHIAHLYQTGLSKVREICLPHFADARYRDVFQNYVIRARRRDELRAHLKSRGIETLLHWPKPLWQHRGLRLGTPQLPKTEAICREVLSLPMSAETTEDHVRLTCAAVSEFYK